MKHKEPRIKEVKIPKERAQLVINYFINAYEDYLSARLLLLNGHLSQGSILANTAVEKYFKGILTIANIPVPRNHNIATKKYKNSLENKFRLLYQSINFEFIEFLSKSYNLRYLDDLEENFSITIIRLKTVAELDFLIGTIENFFIIGDNSRPNRFQNDKNNNNTQLLSNNYYLNSSDKTKFIEQLDLVCVFRLMPNKEIFQYCYYTKEIINDGIFNYEGCKPIPLKPGVYQLYFKPVNSAV